MTGPYCYTCGLQVTYNDRCYGCNHFICLDTRHWNKDGYPVGLSHTGADHGPRWPVKARKRRHAMKARQI